MSDYISREAALQAMEWKWAGKAAFDAVKEVPAADVREVKRGKWNLICMANTFGGTYSVLTCSCCQYKVVGKSNFCPNCGANMREEK